MPSLSVTSLTALTRPLVVQMEKEGTTQAPSCLLFLFVWLFDNYLWNPTMYQFLWAVGPDVQLPMPFLTQTTCISFLLLIQQTTTNLVASNSIHLLSYSCVGQTFDTGLAGLKSRCWLHCISSWRL